MLRAPKFIATLSLLFATAAGAQTEELNDLYFGEALYYAQQGLYFEALERLDTEVRQHEGVDERELDTLFAHMDEAGFSLGDFELRYRMHHRAGRAIRAVLEGAVEDSVRNDAAYRLARIHFQKGQFEEALTALARIEGEVPESIEDDIEFLRANVHLATGDQASSFDVLKKLQKSEEYGGFAAYNLGIAYLQNGQRSAAIEQLDIAGSLESEDRGDLAVRDKSNLVLGTLFLEGGDAESALPYLNRVRLDGPYSNQALLSAGWASLTLEDYERAVVPWGILAKREVTDAATQEALLALPYAYSQLQVHGRAAVHYGYALDAFVSETKKLDESIESIRAGSFLEALVREEIRKDKDWVIRLRSLPESPETYYLMELLASHDFQTGLQNYLDLADLRRKLVSWEGGFDAYEEMVDIRRDHYDPLLPDIDESFRELDSRLKLRREQHETLVKRRDDLLTMPRPEFLATPEEQQLMLRIEAIESRLAGGDPVVSSDEMQRLGRLKGILAFNLKTSFHERLTTFDRNVRSLEQAMVTVEAEYKEFVRVRQAAAHSYTGYDKPMQNLRADVKKSVQKIDQLMAHQGHLLEVLAIEELQARRDHLDNYGDKARFALADSYDRATQAQAMLEEGE